MTDVPDPRGPMGERAPVGSIVVEPDPELEPLLVPRDRLLEVYEHARECYPEECCGVLTGAFEGSFERGVRCTNLQNRRHATGESALDACQAFWIDEMELLQALREAEAQEQRVVAVYHSHTDAGAYLSQADVSAALGPDGLPLWPGVGHLVVSVEGGTVRSCAYFSWDEVRRNFIGRAVREGP